MDVAIASAEKLGQRLIKFKTENGVESVNASHILVDSEEKALELYAKIASGELVIDNNSEMASPANTENTTVNIIGG